MHDEDSLMNKKVFLVVYFAVMLDVQRDVNKIIWIKIL